MRETIRICGWAEGLRAADHTAQGTGFATSTISRALAISAADDRITETVFLFDSQGGNLDGIPELADEIRAAGQTKATTAMVTGRCTSAAYWLAACCQQIVIAPNAVVGGVGVITEPLGHNGTGEYYVSAGSYKAENRTKARLSAERTASLQAEADRLYDKFVGAVAAGRGVSRAEVIRDYGGGRALDARTALQAGMVDRVATSLDATEVSAAHARRTATLRSFSSPSHAMLEVAGRG